ncbi:hypothetical protein GE21DRAFT_1281703 [Neurospora crassa]|nr:hypothetical protein GE21DRAFT_1281703 [Neurospora crassa]
MVALHQWTSSADHSLDLACGRLSAHAKLGLRMVATACPVALLLLSLHLYARCTLGPFLPLLKRNKHNTHSPFISIPLDVPSQRPHSRLHFHHPVPFHFLTSFDSASPTTFGPSTHFPYPPASSPRHDLVPVRRPCFLIACAAV